LHSTIEGAPARSSFRHRTIIAVLRDDSEINANDRDIKETFIQRHNRDEEERSSQTGDVNSVTLNMLGKVNKGGGYCHKIFEFSLPPYCVATGDIHPVLIPHTLLEASQTSVAEVRLSFLVQSWWAQRLQTNPSVISTV
jgi:hypothetical protein